MIDFSNPESELVFDLEYFNTQGVPGILKDTANAVKQRGYYTLGDFFSELNDIQLHALADILEGTVSTDQQEQRICYHGMFMLTTILLIGQGNQRVKIREVAAVLQNFASYIAYEVLARAVHSPNVMQAKRKHYDLDKFYTVEGK